MKLLFSLTSLLFFSGCVTTDSVVKNWRHLTDTYFDELLYVGMTEVEFEEQWVNRLSKMKSGPISGISPSAVFNYYNKDDNYKINVYTVFEVPSNETINLIGKVGPIRKEYVSFKNGSVNDWGVGLMPDEELLQRLNKRIPENDGSLAEIFLGDKIIPQEFEQTDRRLGPLIKEYSAYNYKGFSLVNIQMIRISLDDDFIVGLIDANLATDSKRDSINAYNTLKKDLEDKFKVKFTLDTSNENIELISFNTPSTVVSWNKEKKRRFNLGADSGYLSTNYEGVKGGKWYVGHLEASLTGDSSRSYFNTGVSDLTRQLFVQIEPDYLSISIHSFKYRDAFRLNEEWKRRLFHDVTL